MGTTRLQVMRKGQGVVTRGPASAGRLSSTMPAFSMAFQPIVDTELGRTVAFEALVRGMAGESAATVLSQIADANRYGFDEACRVVAVEKAAMLGLVEMGTDLHVNLYPNAMHEAAGAMDRTMQASACVGLPLARMVIEMSEVERLRDPDRLKAMLREYREDGLRFAIDDFGAGFAGLSALAAFQPDIVKVDLALTERIEERRTSRVIVAGVQRMCAELGIEVIAEGVEQEGQCRVLREIGIRYMQGNLFAPATFEALPTWGLGRT